MISKFNATSDNGLQIVELSNEKIFDSVTIRYNGDDGKFAGKSSYEMTLPKKSIPVLEELIERFINHDEVREIEERPLFNQREDCIQVVEVNSRDFTGSILLAYEGANGEFADKNGYRCFIRYSEILELVGLMSEYIKFRMLPSYEKLLEDRERLEELEEQAKEIAANIAGDLVIIIKDVHDAKDNGDQAEIELYHNHDFVSLQEMGIIQHIDTLKEDYKEEDGVTESKIPSEYVLTELGLKVFEYADNATEDSED